MLCHVGLRDRSRLVVLPPPKVKVWNPALGTEDIHVLSSRSETVADLREAFQVVQGGIRFHFFSSCVVPVRCWSCLSSSSHSSPLLFSCSLRQRRCSCWETCPCPTSNFSSLWGTMLVSEEVRGAFCISFGRITQPHACRVGFLDCLAHVMYVVALETCWEYIPVFCPRFFHSHPHTCAVHSGLQASPCGAHRALSGFTSHHASDCTLCQVSICGRRLFSRGCGH